MSGDPVSGREGNPSGESDAGLAGDLGISSERTGPFEGIEGTGTSGSAQGRTDGDSPTHPEDAGLAHEGDPARSPSVDGDEEPEENPAEVHSHDRREQGNPGHAPN